MSQALITESNLTAIANAIRAKNGLSASYTPAQMPAAIGEISSYPDSYVVQEALRVANQVSSHGIVNGFRILALSDSHIDRTNAQLVTSAKHAGQAASLLRRALEIDCCMWLGDATAGGSNTTYDNGVAEIRQMHANLADAFGSLPQFHSVGNHDNLHFSSDLGGHTPIYRDEMYNLVGVYSTGTVDPQNLKGGYCYQDFVSKQIRVICLNSAETTADTQSKDLWISGRQLQWFADRLGEVGSKSDAANWGVIICCHHPIDWQTFRVSQIIKAYLNGSAVSLAYDGITISYNFSGKNSAKLIAQIHGHTHNYLMGKLHAIGYSGGAIDEGEMDVVRLAVPNVCFGRNNEYGRNSGTESNGVEFGETTTYNKTADSGQDTAFVVVSIDLDRGVIYADHYGAGYDRTYNYVTAQYTITINSLGKAEISNMATSIEEGQTYSATLTVPSGYTIGSVTVLMGGVDISATAYNNGTISIANVTGNITISCVTSGYTNLINTIGYTDGYRLSTSKGTLSAATGYTTSGFIDLTPWVDKGETVVIRTSGVDMRKSTHSNATWCCYHTDETFVGGGYLTEGTSTNYGTIAFDASGNMTWTLTPDNMPLKSVNNRPLLRIAGYGSGANWTITINEVIT